MTELLGHQELEVFWACSSMEHWDSLGFLIVTLNYNVTIVGKYFKRVLFFCCFISRSHPSVLLIINFNFRLWFCDLHSKLFSWYLLEEVYVFLFLLKRLLLSLWQIFPEHCVKYSGKVFKFGSSWWQGLLGEEIMVKTHRSNAELIPHKVNDRMYAIALVTN